MDHASVLSWNRESLLFKSTGLSFLHLVLDGAWVFVMAQLACASIFYADCFSENDYSVLGYECYDFGPSLQLPCLTCTCHV